MLDVRLLFAHSAALILDPGRDPSMEGGLSDEKKQALGKQLLEVLDDLNHPERHLSVAGAQFLNKVTRAAEELVRTTGNVTQEQLAPKVFLTVRGLQTALDLHHLSWRRIKADVKRRIRPSKNVGFYVDSAA